MELDKSSDESDDEDDDDYSSDDDVPIAELKRKQEIAAHKKKLEETKKKRKLAETKKKEAKKKATAKAKAAKSVKKKAASTSKQKITKSSNTSITASSELYAKADKGKLIQSLLCRWWYAIEWPEKDVLALPTPKYCDPLKGFPGVFIVTRGDNIGQIIDHRKMDTCPSFKNFARKSSEELQSLLIKAIEKQILQLQEHEGTGTVTEIGLNKLKSWARKVNCKKSDKDAEKVLRVSKLTLP